MKNANLFYMWRRKTILMCLLCLVSSVAAFAQQKTITGVVNDVHGTVVGATVMVKGSQNGTITDLDGNFKLDGLTQGDIIVISYVGYETQEITYNNQTNLKLFLVEDTKALDEIVVTALGIKRETKALGYAVTEISGDDLKSNTINPVAALQGKAAGVEISGSDGGMFGSTKIQIRGASTLSGNNQPIYVVDGVILENATSSSGDADWHVSANDWGNALKNLNPDDFATVTVLKGASATALYGSRGLNGAIVITTKSGSNSQGFGVSISQTFGIDHVYREPELNYKYGPGTISGYVNYGEQDASGNYYAFDNQRQFRLNSDGNPTLIGASSLMFGPAYDGRSIESWDFNTRRYSPVHDFYKKIYNLGFNSNTNVSVQGGNEKTTFYSSLSYKKATGVLPRNTFDRFSFMAKGTHEISDRVKVGASITYAASKPRNPLPSVGDEIINSRFNAMYDADEYRHKYKGTHGGLADSDYGDEYGYVPNKSFWWNIYENDLTRTEINIRPTFNIDVKITNWLTLKGEANYNLYNIKAETKKPDTGYANTGNGGSYALSQSQEVQTNANINLVANKQLNDNWSMNGFLRGEYFSNTRQYNSSATKGGLIVPGQYFISNSKQTPTQEAYISGEKTILSVAYQLGIGWRNQLFLDVTGRNDWSSALVYTDGTGNYSYFYPSVNGSWIISESFELPSWISFAKVRGSWAQVGNDTEAYKINTAYSLGNTELIDGFLYRLSFPSTQYANSLKPERKNSWELGLDWRFLNNRIGLDATYYRENTYDQIMTINTPAVSGIKAQLINAGNIQNSGIEIALKTTPFVRGDWEVNWDFTYTKNNSKIVELHDNVSDYISLTGSAAYGNYRIASVAKKGGAYGLLMSDSRPKIDEKTGLNILTWNNDRRVAYEQRSGEVEELGSMVPDFLGSSSLNVRWKNLSLSASFDARFGGYIASFGSRYGTSSGITKESLGYRDAENGGITWTSTFDGKTYSDGLIPNGLIAGGATISQANGTIYTVAEGGESYESLYKAGVVEPMHASAYWYFRNSWGTGVVNDSWFKKLNYIAFRELSLNYRLPNSVVSKIGAKNMSVSLTGRNLGYLLNTAPNKENPEGVRGTQSTEFRMRSFSPYTASYMFTIFASF